MRNLSCLMSGLITATPRCLPFRGLRDINRKNLPVEGVGFVRMLAAESAIGWGYVARDTLGRELFYNDALLARLGGGFASPWTEEVLNAPGTDPIYDTADDVFNDRSEMMLLSRPDPEWAFLCPLVLTSLPLSVGQKGAFL